jgi:hypothetical protein
MPFPKAIASAGNISPTTAVTNTSNQLRIAAVLPGAGDRGAVGGIDGAVELGATDPCEGACRLADTRRGEALGAGYGRGTGGVLDGEVARKREQVTARDVVKLPDSVKVPGKGPAAVPFTEKL